MTIFHLKNKTKQKSDCIEKIVIRLIIQSKQTFIWRRIWWFFLLSFESWKPFDAENFLSTKFKHVPRTLETPCGTQSGKILTPKKGFLHFFTFYLFFAFLHLFAQKYFKSLTSFPHSSLCMFVIIRFLFFLLSFIP